MDAAQRMEWSIGLLFVSTLLQVITGVSLALELNPVIVFETGDIHKYNGLALACLIAYHTWLNRTWFRMHFLKRR